MPAASRSKSRLHGRQPPEETPGQPRVVGKKDAMSLGHHGRYIAICSGFYNESKLALGVLRSLGKREPHAVLNRREPAAPLARPRVMGVGGNWRMRMNPTILAAAVALALSASAAEADLVRKPSAHSVKETIDRLETAVKEKGLTVFARIDHAAGAQKANLALRSTELVIFGSPQVGTPLMQAEQTMGLALPLKVLAFEDASGKVWLAYEAPADMAATHGVAKDNPAIGKISGALDGFTTVAASK